MDKSSNLAVFRPPHPALVAHTLAVVGAGRQQGTWGPFSDRILASHGLVLVTEGSGHYFDHQFPAGARVVGPSLMWLVPGHPHGYGPDSFGWTEHWMLFDGPATSLYEKLGLITAQRPIDQLSYVDRASIDRVISLFGAIELALREPGNAADLESSALVHAVLAQAARWREVHPARDMRELDLMTLLAGDAPLPLTVAQRAERLGLTVANLRRLVFMHTGRRLVDHLLDLRTSKAQELLVATTQSIQQIGRIAGFDDPAYFSRVFTRRVGMSPREFRRQQGRDWATGHTPLLANNRAKVEPSGTYE